MARRSEVSAERRKSCPGALTKGIRHRCSKGTDLEHQGDRDPAKGLGTREGVSGRSRRCITVSSESEAP